MVKQTNPPINDEIRTLLGDSIVDSWNQDKVSQWLDQKGWGHFAPTFSSKNQKIKNKKQLFDNNFLEHGICHERFFEITLAELVEYLPRFFFFFFYYYSMHKKKLNFPLKNSDDVL